MRRYWQDPATKLWNVGLNCALQQVILHGLCYAEPCQQQPHHSHILADTFSMKRLITTEVQCGKECLMNLSLNFALASLLALWSSRQCVHHRFNDDAWEYKVGNDIWENSYTVGHWNFSSLSNRSDIFCHIICDLSRTARIFGSN